MGGNGSGGGTTTVYQPVPSGGTSTVTPTIPEELKPLVKQSAATLQDIQTQAPMSEYLAANPQQIAPLTALQEQGAAMTANLGNMPLNEVLSQQASLLAPYTASAPLRASYADDPLVMAQQRAFEANAMPLIQNQMAKAGLGASSSLADALARGEAATLPGAIQTALGTELAQQQTLASTLGQSASNLAGLGGADTARQAAAINAAMQVGGTQQANTQASLNAAYQDYLRRMGISEQALMGPAGLFPSTIGQSTVSTGTQYLPTSTQASSGGGLFK